MGGGQDNLAVIYYLSASDIWPDKRRMAFGERNFIRGGTTVIIISLSYLLLISLKQFWIFCKQNMSRLEHLKYLSILCNTVPFVIVVDRLVYKMNSSSTSQ